MKGVTRFKQSLSHAKETQARAAIACFRLGHTTLRVHLHCLPLSPGPFCPWCKNTPVTIEHFLLQCLRFHSHHTAPRSRLSALAITTLNLLTLLASSGVHPSRQPAVLSLICAFFRRPANYYACDTHTRLPQSS
ncbi:hypothetical protein E2C01_020604 [Portunus trituberculatus]|uniref:Reverse transcriptase zinc-binding domain-containing protein n=1 Tax=Portunus trituberculatus TaxID=210409 RepID=A0A5B7E1Z5_PORTR|nr:hypothetical protein [Portunus trituberculatus]